MKITLLALATGTQICVPEPVNYTAYKEDLIQQITHHQELRNAILIITLILIVLFFIIIFYFIKRKKTTID